MSMYIKLILCVVVFLFFWALIHCGTRYDKDD